MIYIYKIYIYMIYIYIYLYIYMIYIYLSIYLSISISILFYSIVISESADWIFDGFSSGSTMPPTAYASHSRVTHKLHVLFSSPHPLDLAELRRHRNLPGWTWLDHVHFVTSNMFIQIWGAICSFKSKVWKVKYGSMGMRYWYRESTPVRHHCNDSPDLIGTLPAPCLAAPENSRIPSTGLRLPLSKDFHRLPIRHTHFFPDICWNVLPFADTVPIAPIHTNPNHQVLGNTLCSLRFQPSRPPPGSASTMSLCRGEKALKTSCTTSSLDAASWLLPKALRIMNQISKHARPYPPENGWGRDTGLDMFRLVKCTSHDRPGSSPLSPGHWQLLPMSTSPAWENGKLRTSRHNVFSHMFQHPGPSRKGEILWVVKTFELKWPRRQKFPGANWQQFWPFPQWFWWAKRCKK